MRPFGLSLSFMAIVGCVGFVVPQIPSAPTPVPCDVAITPQIRDVLRSKFTGWRPKRLSDMDADDQKSWLSGPNGKACPGIAIGHFETVKETSYALLLVPNSQSVHGYKVVVLSKESTGESYVPKLLDSNGAEIYSGLVISKANPGTFSDLEEGKEIRIELDGVIVEWIEKGAVLYYWSAGRYRRVTISD
jgi:hypothetical protein